MTVTDAYTMYHADESSLVTHSSDHEKDQSIMYTTLASNVRFITRSSGLIVIAYQVSLNCCCWAAHALNGQSKMITFHRTIPSMAEPRSAHPFWV